MHCEACVLPLDHPAGSASNRGGCLTDPRHILNGLTLPTLYFQRFHPLSIAIARCRAHARALVIDFSRRAREHSVLRGMCVAKDTPGVSFVALGALRLSDHGTHRHHAAETVVLLDGDARAIVDAEERAISTGDVVHVPAGATHDVVNTGNETLRLLGFFGKAEVKTTFELVQMPDDTRVLGTPQE